MYNTGRPLNPTKPVVTTLTQANRELNNWLAENNYNYISDAAGLRWNLEVNAIEKPSTINPKRPSWELTFKLQAYPNAEELVRTGTLSETDDARLLSLLGDKSLPLHMRPQKLIAPTIEEARSRMAQTILDLRTSMAAQTLHETKRSLIERFINEESAFKFR